MLILPAFTIGGLGVFREERQINTFTEIDVNERPLDRVEYIVDIET